MNREMCEHFTPAELDCEKCRALRVRKMAAEFLSYAIFECERTREMQCGEIISALEVFFTATEIKDSFQLIRAQSYHDRLQERVFRVAR